MNTMYFTLSLPFFTFTQNLSVRGPARDFPSSLPRKTLLLSFYCRPDRPPHTRNPAVITKRKWCTKINIPLAGGRTWCLRRDKFPRWNKQFCTRDVRLQYISTKVLSQDSQYFNQDSNRRLPGNKIMLSSRNACRPHLSSVLEHGIILRCLSQFLQTNIIPAFPNISVTALCCGLSLEASEQKKCGTEPLLRSPASYFSHTL
jgi:hypothetical protein